MTFWHRIASLCIFSVVLTVILVIVIQSAYLNRAVEQFDPVFQKALTQLQTTPDMSQQEQFRLFRVALRRTANDSAEFEQYTTQLSAVLDMQRRLPRLAALIALLVVLPLSAGVAWLIARPIRSVSEAATQIAQGDLGARVAPSWQVRGKRGELAELAYNFNAMAEVLGRLERERQEMIADIAHELRTPLSILQGQIDAMREGVRPLDQGALTKLDRQTQRLAVLIDDLRTLSLANAGRLTLEPVAIALVPFVERLVDNFDQAANSVRLTFTTSVKRDVKIEADPNRLEQVLGKLLENALQRTPEGGSVEVNVGEEAGTAKLSVRDSGPSLSGEALTLALNQFYQSESHWIGTLGGGGLDLAIVHALMELHGGHVNVANLPTGGARFTIFLPV